MTHHSTRLDPKQFAQDPCRFLDHAIKEYVAVSPLNCLTTFNNAPFFDEPVVAFADGDDAIFQDFKTVIGDFHFTPREALEMHVRAKGWKLGVKSHIENVGVISYALPLSYETRLSERRTPYGGSPRYNHTRWRGETFFRSLSHYISSILEAMGYHA